MSLYRLSVRNCILASEIKIFNLKSFKKNCIALNYVGRSFQFSTKNILFYLLNASVTKYSMP